MTRTTLPFVANDVSTLARSLGRELAKADAVPSHLQLLNMLARATGYQNFQHFRAQTEAQTAITIAKGEAEANRVKAIALNSSGGQKVLAREWIQKWDGKLPTVSGSGNQNLIDLRSLMGPEPAKK